MDARAQVEAARQRALAVPRPDWTTLIVTGSDRLSWLNGLLTCDLLKREPGAALYGLAVARNGRVLCDATVAIDDDGQAASQAMPGGRVLVAIPRAVAAGVRAHLDHYLVMEDAAVAPEADAFEAWAIHGPQSSQALGAARAAGAVGGSIDSTGLGGALVLAPALAGAAVRLALEESAVIGDDAGWEALRLERAVPRFGVDFDEKTYPQEAGLEKVAVSFDKGCYLGQEVVCMLEMRGHVKRRLAALVLEPHDGAQPPVRGAVVTDEGGGEVGEITSAGSSPTLGKEIALAMVKRAAGEPGRELRVGGAPARVVERPA
jgi:folate-binding protein YgfZ